jgi:hypothetical protein
VRVALGRPSASAGRSARPGRDPQPAGPPPSAVADSAAGTEVAPAPVGDLGDGPAAGRAAADPAGAGRHRTHRSVRRHLRPAAQRLLRVALDGVDAAVPGVAARPPGRGGDPDPAGGPYRKGPFDRLPDTAFTAHTGTDPDGQVHNYRLAETTVELPLPNRAGGSVALRQVHRQAVDGTQIPVLT